MHGCILYVNLAYMYPILEYSSTYLIYHYNGSNLEIESQNRENLGCKTWTRANFQYLLVENMELTQTSELNSVSVCITLLD